MLALVRLRQNKTPPALKAGFGVSAATVWRYVAEQEHVNRARTRL
ncbi:transposase family protein [Streptomyces sp. NBC_01077]